MFVFYSEDVDIKPRPVKELDPHRHIDETELDTKIDVI